MRKRRRTEKKDAVIVGIYLFPRLPADTPSAMIMTKKNLRQKAWLGLELARQGGTAFGPVIHSHTQKRARNQTHSYKDQEEGSREESKMNSIR